jgi:four helix bundle protein
MRNDKENLIVSLTFAFARKIFGCASALEEQRKFVIARQLLRAGTGIGANVREAQNAESKADFIHKMKIAAKEADETEYWLLLIDSIDGYPDCKGLLLDCSMIVKVLSKIISSSRK